MNNANMHMNNKCEIPTLYKVGNFSWLTFETSLDYINNNK